MTAPRFDDRWLRGKCFEEPVRAARHWFERMASWNRLWGLQDVEGFIEDACAEEIIGNVDAANPFSAHFHQNFGVVGRKLLVRMVTVSPFSTVIQKVGMPVAT